jgi:hypothetical protein
MMRVSDNPSDKKVIDAQNAEKAAAAETERKK